MPRTFPTRIIIITSFLIAFVAVASSAKWSSGSWLFTANDVATVHAEAQITGGKVPDGLSASDWNAIRAAHDAARGRNIEGFSQDAYLKPAAVGTTQTGDEF